MKYTELTKLKKGDKLKCVENKGVGSVLTLNKTYSFIKIEPSANEEYTRVYVVNDRKIVDWFYSIRFELLNTEQYEIY